MHCNSKDSKRINSALDELRENIQSLVLGGGVTRVPAESLTPLRFYREYISKSLPVIITGGMDTWAAMTRWNLHYLSEKLGDQKVTVDFTPDGRGDSVNTDGTCFVTPATEKMKFSDFAEIMTKERKLKGSNRVAYCQHQNSNFSQEFKALHSDVNPIGFAEEAFGEPPDAVNIWVGDERSVSSLHRDPYENIYCVVTGVKRFTLLPPTDGPFLCEQPFPGYQYTCTPTQRNTKVTTPNTNDDSPGGSGSQFSEKNSDGDGAVKSSGRPMKFSDKGITKISEGCQPPTPLWEWGLKEDIDGQTGKQMQVPWIPVDPDFPDRIKKSAACLKFSEPKKISPIRCEVRRGEILFLPSLWFHQVSQQGVTIAVNYWYDMSYGLTWSLIQYLEQVCCCRRTCYS